MKLHLHHVEARQGAVWVQQGWQVFRRAPLPLTALLATFFIGAALLGLLGVVGAALALAVAPLLNLIFMLASHQVVQGRAISFALWAQPFKLAPERSRNQLRLGLIFLVCAGSVLGLLSGVDDAAQQRLGEAMTQLQQATPGQEAAAREALSVALSDPELLQGNLLRLGAALLLSLPFWHAPALVHWGGHGPLKALFGSCVGLWHNRAAYAVHGLVWLGLMLAAGSLLSLLLALLPALAVMLVTPLSLLAATVFYAGLYFSFMDSFRFNAEAAP